MQAMLLTADRLAAMMHRPGEPCIFCGAAMECDKHLFFEMPIHC